MKGTVIKFDDRKGYGFIQPDGKDEQAFVHAEEVTTAGRLTAGQRVSFEITHSAKGLRAINVAVDGAPTRQSQRSRPSSVSPYWLFGGPALVGTILLMTLGIMILSLPWLLAYLIAINLTTFILYAYDRVVAGSGALRVPERILHAAELFGGTPAGFVGQQALDHKSAKGSYQRDFWRIVIIQVLIIVVLIYLGLV